MSRRYCRCLEGDGIEALRAVLVRTEKCITDLEAGVAALEGDGDKKKALERQLKAVAKTQKAQQNALRELAKQEALHNGLHRAQYARSMIDLAKKRSINVAKSSEPLQNSGWRVGDVKRLREGPKNAKRRKKKRSKKNNTK